MTQDLHDALREAYSDALDVDGFSPSTFILELLKRGWRIVPADEDTDNVDPGTSDQAS